MTNNERLYWKNRDPEKYKVLQEWDSIRLPILQKLKETNRDIRLKKEDKHQGKIE